MYCVYGLDHAPTRGQIAPNQTACGEQWQQRQLLQESHDELLLQRCTAGQQRAHKQAAMTAAHQNARSH